MTSFSILFENDQILLINKPAGVSVQGGAGISHPLDEELSRQMGYKIHLVHRLDKETSGILVVAKNPQSAAAWTKLIGQKEVTKEYIALCAGTPSVQGKSSPKGTIRSVVQAHGREQTAELHYEVSKTAAVTLPVAEVRSQNGAQTQSLDKTQTQNQVQTQSQTPETVPLSLVKITLGTGRMHQIRIQMAKNGAPLAADDQHGNFKLNKKLRKLGIKKMCLCAYRLTIPLEGKKRTFEIPLPEYFQSALDSFF